MRYFYQNSWQSGVSRFRKFIRVETQTKFRFYNILRIGWYIVSVSNEAPRNESFYFTAERTRRSQRREFFQGSAYERVTGVPFEGMERDGRLGEAKRGEAANIPRPAVVPDVKSLRDPRPSEKSSMRWTRPWRGSCLPVVEITRRSDLRPSRATSEWVTIWVSRNITCEEKLNWHA